MYKLFVDLSTILPDKEEKWVVLETLDVDKLDDAAKKDIKKKLLAALSKKKIRAKIENDISEVFVDTTISDNPEGAKAPSSYVKEPGHPG